MGCHPFKSFLEEVLTNGSANDQVFAQTIGSAICLGEMTLGITHKRTGINGIMNLLVVERFTCNVDGLEPFQFLRFFSFTYINCQLIVEDSPSYVCRLIRIKNPVF